MQLQCRMPPLCKVCPPPQRKTQQRCKQWHKCKACRECKERRVCKPCRQCKVCKGCRAWGCNLAVLPCRLHSSLARKLRVKFASGSRHRMRKLAREQIVEAISARRSAMLKSA